MAVSDMNTPPVHLTPDERSRKMLTFVLQRLDGRQSEIAAAMGVSESTVSRFKNEELQKLCRVLAYGGMKITPAEFKCYDPKQIDALFTLAKGQFDRAENVDDVLLWEG